jgi:hypothetical protein
MSATKIKLEGTDTLMKEIAGSFETLEKGSHTQTITICPTSLHGNELNYLTVKRKGRFCHGVNTAAVTGSKDYHHRRLF